MLSTMGRWLSAVLFAVALAPWLAPAHAQSRGKGCKQGQTGSRQMTTSASRRTGSRQSAVITALQRRQSALQTALQQTNAYLTALQQVPDPTSTQVALAAALQQRQAALQTALQQTNALLTAMQQTSTSTSTSSQTMSRQQTTPTAQTGGQQKRCRR
jgi:hypothetical protein